MKITKKAREKYMELCKISTYKCDALTEIDYKIERCVSLGKMVLLDGEGVGYYIYYNMMFLVKNDKVVDIKKDAFYFNYISEKKKRVYDKVKQNMVV